MAFILAALRRQILLVKSVLGMSVMLSMLKAQDRGIPSALPNLTSVGMLRIRLVAGTAITEWRSGIAAWRVRMRKGLRFPEGERAHQISPRFTRALIQSTPPQVRA